MKNKLTPIEIGNITPQEGQDVDNEEGRPVFDTDTSASDLEFQVLIGNYVGQIIEQVENETIRIICIPWVLDIWIETGFNLKDSSKIYEKVLEHMEDVIFWKDFALNDEGVIFKDMPTSKVYN